MDMKKALKAVFGFEVIKSGTSPEKITAWARMLRLTIVQDNIDANILTTRVNDYLRKKGVRESCLGGEGRKLKRRLAADNLTWFMFMRFVEILGADELTVGINITSKAGRKFSTNATIQINRDKRKK